MITGVLAYGVGDSIAALLSGQWMAGRLLAMVVMGGLVYAWEIPACFRAIVRRVPDALPPARRAVGRTLLATFYFNPLWIARHFLIIELGSGRLNTVGWDLLGTATRSFAVTLPLTLVGNYIIQMHLPLRYRFVGSALFSGFMAVCYALTAVM